MSVMVAADPIVAPREEVTGMYATLWVEVDGQRVQDHGIPWLVLGEDNTFNWGREEGSFQCNEQRILFEGLYSEWGWGKLSENGDIVFKFIKEDKIYMIKMFQVTQKINFRKESRKLPKWRKMVPLFRFDLS